MGRSTPRAPRTESTQRPSEVRRSRLPSTRDRQSLGSGAFREHHGVKYAYVAGAMAKGIGSADLVIRMGRAGLLSYYGSGGQRIEVVESAIRKIRVSLTWCGCRCSA